MKHYSTSIDILSKIALASADILEAITSEKDLLYLLEGQEPIKNEDGENELILVARPDPAFVAYLKIGKDEVAIDVQDDYKFAKAILKDCWTKNYLLNRWGVK